MLPVKGRLNRRPGREVNPTGTTPEVQAFFPEAGRDTGLHVLVVDDDAGVGRMLCQELQSQGYTAFQLLDGLQTLRAIDDKRPDVVVLDSHLGRGIDGFALCERIKARETTRHLPVIMISGVIKGIEDQERAMRLGAVEYLIKPFTAGTLRAAVGAALEQARRKKAEIPRLDGTIVVIDDDMSWLNLTVGWLKSAGAVVVGGLNEDDAVRLALEHRPDCIVLDYQLQTKTASQVCRELKAHRSLQKIPVIVHSARQNQKIRALTDGADHFVPKSASGEELVAVALACIRRRNEGILVKGDLKLDSAGNEVYHGGKLAAKLTDEQFQFLYALVERSPAPRTRADLTALLARPGVGDETSKALDKLAERIRDRIGAKLGRRIRSGKEFGWVYDPNAPLG